MIEKYYIVENPDFIKESRFLEKAKKDRYQMSRVAKDSYVL